MGWQTPPPVSRRLRYAVFTLILLFVAFFLVVTYFAVAGLLPPDAVQG
jgi:hypothetical protein